MIEMINNMYMLYNFNKYIELSGYLFQDLIVLLQLLLVK